MAHFSAFKSERLAVTFRLITGVMKPQARKVRKKNSALKKKVRKKNSVFVRGTTAIKVKCY